MRSDQISEGFGKVGTNGPKLTEPGERIKRLERELQEYIRVESLLVECRVVTRDRLEQAHGLIRDLMDMQS